MQTKLDVNIAIILELARAPFWPNLPTRSLLLPVYVHPSESHGNIYDLESMMNNPMNEQQANAYGN